jgi:hypothetical protein
MRFKRKAIGAGWLLALAFSFGVAPVRAQQGPGVKNQGKKTEAASQAKPGDGPTSKLARLREQLTQTAQEYKSSLEHLLALYEVDVKRADERLAKMKELYAQGLVSRREVETVEVAAASAGEKVAEVRGQLKSADVQIAETLVEAESEEAAGSSGLNVASRAGGSLVQTVAYTRYGGARVWSLSEAAAIKQFFMRRFGRALPVGAFGQSPLHNRWNYDHRNAMDVGLHPDSLEGRALMEYLRAAGIPFTAFRYAIPGRATGPHIHVGLPSRKVMPRQAVASDGWQAMR